MVRKLDLRWSDPFAVKDVLGFYKDLLPIIVQVDEGYNGIIDEESYSRDDMYIITEVRHQKRVAALAVTTRGKQACVHISVPLISRARFHVQNRDGSKTKNAETLLDIDRNIGLAEDMKLLPDINNPVSFNQFKGDGKPGKPIIFEELTVTNVFSQGYLIGFPLPELRAPHDLTVIFPVHMDLKFKVADSLDGGTKRDFKAFVDNTYLKTSHFLHDVAIHGTTEIMLYSEEMGDEDPYEYASPADYIRFSELRQLHHQSATPTVKAARRNVAYEMNEIKREIPDVKQQSKSYYGRPPAPDPISDDEEDMKENISRQKLSRNRTPSTSSDKDIPEQDSQMKQAIKTPPPVAAKPSTKAIKQIFSRHLSQSKMTDMPLKAILEARNSNSGQHSSQTSTYSKKDLRIISPIPSLDLTPASPSARPVLPILPITRPTVAVVPMARSSSDRSGDTRTKAQEPTQTTPKEGQPMSSREKIVQQNKRRSKSPQRIYNSFAEIPKDISALTTHEIAACLRRMNMDKYVDAFKELQIDGTLLLALSEDDLENDFKMTKTEVKKIGLFAHKQWRPNAQ